MLEKKIIALNKAAKKKQQDALFKTEQAIAKLTKQEQKITIRSVAREAGVSVSYIYKYPELASKIQRLKETQKSGLVKSNQPKATLPDRSLEKIELENQKIRRENAKLVRENQELRAIIEQQKTGKNDLEHFKSDNSRLAVANQRLKQELQYIQTQLHEAREFILGKGTIEQTQPKVDINLKEIFQMSEK